MEHYVPWCQHFILDASSEFTCNANFGTDMLLIIIFLVAQPFSFLDLISTHLAVISSAWAIVLTESN